MKLHHVPIAVALAATALLASPTTAAAAPAPKPAAAASPDYDGDGKADLAAVLTGDDEIDRIRVWYGSGGVSDITHTDLGLAEYGIGSALLARDLDGDGYTDLAVSSSSDTGAGVQLIPGSATGLQPADQYSFKISTDSSSVYSMALVESPVRRLAVNLHDYLGSGKYSEEVRLYSLTSPGRPTGTPIILKAGSGKISKTLKNSSFGTALASWGNQLFIGAPSAKVNGKAQAGAVVVVTLDARGVTSARTITQATKGVTGAPDKEDLFGASVAARDGYLVVGTPGDHVGRVKDTGSIQVFSLSRGKVKPVKRISQDSAGIPGKDEPYDLFGNSVAIGQRCNGVPTVLVGAPNEGITHGHYDGSAWLIPLRTAKGCAATQLWAGHGLPGKPDYRGLGGLTAFLRDRGAVDDDLVVGGHGSFSEGPDGWLYWISAKTGKAVVDHESLFNEVAGR